MTARPWVMLAVLFLARTALGFQFQSVVGVSASMMAGLGTGLGDLGILVGAYMLPGVLVSIPGGALGQRFGEKRVALLGLALMAAGGALTAISADMVMATTGRVLAGVGGVSVNILLAGMVAEWFRDRHLVTAMAILVTSWPLGIGLALVLGPFVGGYWDWQAMMWITAAASVVTGIGLALVYRSPPGSGISEANGTQTVRLSGRDFWIATWSGQVWSLFNVGYILVLTFTPALMLSDGVSPAVAGGITSLATWFLIVSVPTGGALIDRFGRGTSVMFVCFGIMAVAMLTPAFVSAAVVTVVIVGLFAGPPAGAIMALPAKALRPEIRTKGMSLYFFWYYVGMAALPPIAGWLGDVTDQSSAPLVFGAGVMVAAMASLAVFAKLMGKTQAVG